MRAARLDDGTVLFITEAQGGVRCVVYEPESGEREGEKGPGALSADPQTIDRIRARGGSAVSLDEHTATEFLRTTATQLSDTWCVPPPSADLSGDELVVWLLDEILL